MSENRKNDSSINGGPGKKSAHGERPIQRNTRTGLSGVPRMPAGSLSDSVDRRERNIRKPVRPAEPSKGQSVRRKSQEPVGRRNHAPGHPVAKGDAARLRAEQKTLKNRQREETETPKGVSFREKPVRKKKKKKSFSIKKKLHGKPVKKKPEKAPAKYGAYSHYVEDGSGENLTAKDRTDERALKAEKWLRENPDPGKPSKEEPFAAKAGYFRYRLISWIKKIQLDPVKEKKAYRIMVIVLALILSLQMVSCLNDIFGLGRSHSEKTIVIDENDTTDNVINKLDKAGLIKNSLCCKLFVKQTSGLRNGEKAEYIKGKYVLTPDMGLEKMLMTCQSVQKHDVRDISIPEGFTVEQIAEKLEKNKICSKDEFIKAANRRDYNSPYVKKIEGEKGRYNLLEGYLYPDTYELYIGEDADSVISKMLANFDRKWEDSYSERAKEMGLSVDEVITLASIVQQEEPNPENMKLVASVFYNRLNSSEFNSLQSDTTTTYLTKNIKPNTSAREYEKYKNRYDTYSCEGLPIGPICSPGADAIKAVLWPEKTGYYYFYHGADGQIHLATTLDEQTRNINRYKH